MAQSKKQIRLGDKVFDLYLKEKTILKKVKELSVLLNQLYAGKNPLFIVVLNGSFMFASDLMKLIKIDCSISFIRYSSYDGTHSTGNIKQIIGLRDDLENRFVILLEDIIDSGNTMQELIREIKSKHPLNVFIATLLYKENPNFPRSEIDFIGFDVPPEFVVGYGLDYMELGRNLTDIYKLIPVA